MLCVKHPRMNVTVSHGRCVKSKRVHIMWEDRAGHQYVSVCVEAHTPIGRGKEQFLNVHLAESHPEIDMQYMCVL